ncbi:hypothetical protein PSEUDO9AG_41073 [Pseudomonas sp. 9Ag]|nr:hypothetical protein PSEUDO9AG_41073 [Pseudomonas sp. 9Ag]
MRSFDLLAVSVTGALGKAVVVVAMGVLRLIEGHEGSGEPCPVGCLLSVYFG